MNARWPAGVLALVVAIGCLPEPAHTPALPHHGLISHRDIPILTVHIDSDFDPIDVQSAAAAVSEWDISLNGNLWLDAVVTDFHREHIDGTGVNIFKVDNTCLFIPAQPDGRMTLAWADSIGGHEIWVVRERMKDIDVLGIVTHELGHVLGAEHTLGGVMNAVYYPFSVPPCIDEAAVEQVALRLMVPLDSMTYCR